MRMKSNLESDHQMFYPKDKTQFWRAELLDNAFDIVLSTCPDVRRNDLLIHFPICNYIYPGSCASRISSSRERILHFSCRKISLVKRERGSEKYDGRNGSNDS